MSAIAFYRHCAGLWMRWWTWCRGLLKPRKAPLWRGNKLKSTPCERCLLTL